MRAQLLSLAAIGVLAGVARSSYVELAPADMCTAVSEDKRVDCGWQGNQGEMQCVEMGCCWDSTVNTTTGIPCFYAQNGVDVTTVHLIASNHFDAGYADLTTNIVNKYFDKFFPLAASVGRDCNGTDTPLKWMTQGWLVGLYLNCPPNIGLHCPSDENIAVFKEAVKAGWITYHAFPHNSHLELARPEMIRAGIQLVHDLDAELGQEKKKVLSLRDVPAPQISILPSLQKEGVSAISVGANGRMVPPNFPPVSLWSNRGSSPTTPSSLYPYNASTTSVEMPIFFHARGYGALREPTPVARLPNFDQVMVYNWRGDNAGPPISLGDVQKYFALAQNMFPKAKVIASSLDTFLSAVEAAGPTALIGVPTITGDAGNTWNMGDVQDPVKHAISRALDRVHTECMEDGCGATDQQVKNFRLLVLKNCEHTFGTSIARFGGESAKRWSNTDFAADLASKLGTINISETSWTEQRNYGIKWPLEALGTSPYANKCNEAIKEYKAASVAPPSKSWEPVPVAPVKVGSNVLEFDASSGKLTKFTDGNGKSVSGTLAGVAYQSLNDDDFQTHYRDEFLVAGTGGGNEYGKQNCNSSISESKIWPATLNYARLSPDKQTLVIATTYAPSSHSLYGAPSLVLTSYTASGNTLNVTISVVSKPATRLPEALYSSFVVDGVTDLLLDIHGQWLNAVNETVVAGARGQRGIQDYIAAVTPGGTLLVQSLDTGLVRIGEPVGPFPQPAAGQPDITQGAHFVLTANPWSTNFPFWYPFEGAEEVTSSVGGRPAADLGWRFKLSIV